MSRHMMERTTVRLPPELLRRARRKAAQEGRTLTSLIEDGLRAVIAESPPDPKQRRTRPRISKASGGLMPGIELSDLHVLQELDDADYLQRTTRRP